MLVSIDKVINSFTRMQDRCVILAADMRAYAGQGSFRKTFREVHRDLPCLNDLPFPGLPLYKVNGDLVVFTDNFLNIFNCYFPS